MNLKIRGKNDRDSYTYIVSKDQSNAPLLFQI